MKAKALKIKFFLSWIKKNKQALYLHHGNSPHGIAKPIRENLIGLLRLLTDSQNKISAAFPYIFYNKKLLSSAGKSFFAMDKVFSYGIHAEINSA